MRRTDFLIGLVILMALMAAIVATPVSRAAGAAAETGIAQQIRARLDAYGRGSASDWARFVADDCICGLETKADIQRAIAARLPSVKNWYGEILDLQVRLLGEAAVARYRITEYTEVGGQRTTLQLWRTETYARRAGVWMLIAGADLVIPPDPTVAKVDPRLFDAYVGKYQYTPGSVDIVTREGGHLFVQPTGEPRVEIFPENETTYFAKGESWRLIFVRDPQGLVTSLIFRQQGQEFVANKVP